MLARDLPSPTADLFSQQRWAVAGELGRLGHEVHFVVSGPQPLHAHAGPVRVHAFEVQRLNNYSDHGPGLDTQLTISQLLYEGLLEVLSDHHCEVVDVPLDSLAGFVTLQRHRGPTVVSVAHFPTKFGPLGPAGKTSLDLETITPKVHRPVVEYSELTAEELAAVALAAYERALEQPASLPASKVYQVMEALDVGDAVSNIARRNAALLSDLGQPATILTRYYHSDVQHERQPIRQAISGSACALIFHYWGLNHSTWVLSAVRGRKAVHFHNVTPSSYFPQDNELYHSTTQSKYQLHQIADQFDLIIGDSRFNVVEFSRYISCPKPAIVIYPVVARDELKAMPYDRHLAETLKPAGQVNILFVGRVARNKRQDVIMRLFDHYFGVINQHARLWLVGNDQVDQAYRSELETLRRSLSSGNRIAFTGKVPDPVLYGYYRTADVFVCASEHEGFCVPLAQAMAFDVPVLAYSAAAVPETMSRSGLLIQRWDMPRVAELMHLAITDSVFRLKLLDGQTENLERFTKVEARRRLQVVIDYLCRGEPDPLISPIEPLTELEHAKSHN